MPYGAFTCKYMFSILFKTLDHTIDIGRNDGSAISLDVLLVARGIWDSCS